MAMMTAPIKEAVPTEWLDEHLESVRLPCWERLFWEGDSPKNFFLVRNGLLGVFRTISASKKILVQLLGRGDSAGVYELLSNHDYRTHVIPIKETVAYRGTRLELEKVESNHPGRCTKLLLKENEIQEELYEKIDEVISCELDTRLARLLVRLANYAGRPRESGGIEISLKLTRKQIGQMMGCATESVIRILSKWEKSGWVSTENRQILILEPERIIELSGCAPSGPCPVEQFMLIA